MRTDDAGLAALVVDALPMGVVVVDRDGRFLAFNPAAERLVGFGAEECAPETWPARWGIHRADRTTPFPFEELVLHRALRGEVVHDQLEFIHNERVEGRFLCVSGTPIREPDGSIRGAVVVFRDATADHLANEELAKARTFLDSIVENIPAMIFVKDAAELRFELFNRAGEDLLGLSRSDLLAKNDYDFFPKEQADFFQAKDRQTLRGGEVLEIAEEPIETPRGQRWLHTRKVPIRDAEGQPAHLLGISIDITDRREAQQALARLLEDTERRVADRTMELRNTEDQLRHAMKMEAIGRLAGGVAHDFNNMLSVIVSHSALVLGEMPASDPIREDLEAIRHAADRASSLTRQLLAFSRKQVMRPKRLDLNQVVRQTERMLQRLVGEDVALVAHLASGMRNVLVDPGLVEQVVVNLVVNARDAMPKGGQLTIETANVDLDETYVSAHLGTTPGPHAMLAVTDTGTGMSDEVKARIFEPFFTTKERGKGTGLGLATVYGIVKQNGGNIFVYSEVGRGTTFKIYFPEALEGERDAPAPLAAPAPTGGGETILLVEDEAMVRAAAREILVRAGYAVLEAADGGEALRLCEERTAPIHLLLTDVVMPGMAGPELARRIGALYPRTRVLCMSGYADEAVFEHGVLDESVAYLEKPFTPEGLRCKVREVLRGKTD